MASDWAVAGGTLALAVVTAWLALQARREVREVRKQAEAVTRQVELEAEQLVAMQRPLVYPVIEAELLRPQRPALLRIKNGGAGAALNIQGAVYWQGGAGGASSIVPTALAPREEALVPIVGEGIQVNWPVAIGFLRYRDLSDIEWQTHFRFRQDGSGNFSIEVVHVGVTESLGEPQYNANGWVNAPDGVSTAIGA